MSLAHLVMQYGYFAVFIGCILEGETVLILSGFAAYQGYLSFSIVMLVASIGGSLGDIFFFLLGRHYGTELMRKYPALQKKSEVFNPYISRFYIWLILSMRFLYGFRIVGPIALGMSKISTKIFVLFNILGAIIWAFLITGAGYLFGQTIELFFKDIKRYEALVFLCIVLISVLVWLVHKFYRRRKLSEK